jgi:WD40 repeat protein
MILGLATVVAGPLAGGPPERGPMPHLVDLYGDPLPVGAVARLGSVRVRHPGLKDFTILADGRTLVSVGGDQLVRRWDLESGRQTDAVTLRAEAGRRVYPDVLSADGSRVAVKEPAAVVVYGTDTGRPVLRVPTESYAAVDVAFSPDGLHLAAGVWGDAGPRLTLYTLATGVGRDLPVEGKARANRDPGLSLGVRFSRDGRRLVAHGPFRPGLVVFDVADGRAAYSGQRPGYEFALSPDGARIADRGPPSYPPKPSAVQLVDLASGKRSIPNALGPTSGNLEFSPDGGVLASFSYWETVLLDLASGRVRHHLPTRSEFGVRFSPDGRLLALTPDGCQLEVWDVATGRLCRDRSGWFDDAAAVSPDGCLVAVPRPDGDGTVLEVWDLATGRRVRSLPRTECYIDQLAFSPDGWRLTAFWGKSRLYTWSATSGTERGPVRFGLPEGWTDSTASVLSPDGRRVAAVDRDFWEPDRSKLEVWEARTATLIHRFLLPPSLPAWDCVWAPDGRTVLLPGEGESALADADTGRVGVRIPVVWVAPRPKDVDLRVPFIDMPVRPRFSPDGGLVVGWKFGGEEAEPDRLQVWETVTGREVIGVAVRLPPKAKYALAPAARALVVADGRSLRVIDLATGNDRGRHELPRGPWAGQDPATSATALWVLPGDRRALTTHPDGTALVWDLSAFPPPPLADKHGEAELRAWWDDLAGEDAARAYAAGWKLAEASAADVVRFLCERVRPARAVDSKEVRERIAELDSPTFATREAAARRLQQMGLAVLPYLRKPPEGLSAEALDRLGKLAKRLADPVPPAETLRMLRAVAVLERVGTNETRKLLEELASGAADAPESKAARATLGRMRQGWAR